MTIRELEELAADLAAEGHKKYPQVHGQAAAEVLWSLARCVKKLAERRRENE